jgi:hypothetical protein
METSKKLKSRNYKELTGLYDISNFGFINDHTKIRFKSINRQFIMHAKTKFRLSSETVKAVMNNIIVENIVGTNLSYIKDIIKHKITEPKSGDIVTTDLDPRLVLNSTNSILVDITDLENYDIDKYLSGYPFSEIDINNGDVSSMLAINTIHAPTNNIICILPPLPPTTCLLRNHFKTILEVMLVEGNVKTKLYMIEFKFSASREESDIASIIQVNLSNTYPFEGLFSVYENFSYKGFHHLKYGDDFQEMSSIFIKFDHTSSEVRPHPIESDIEQTSEIDILHNINKINYIGHELLIKNVSREETTLKFENIKETEHNCVPIYKSMESDKDRDSVFHKLRDVLKFIQTKYSDENFTKNISRYTMNVTIYRDNSVFFENRFSKPEVRIGDINRVILELNAFDSDSHLIYSFNNKVDGVYTFEYFIYKNDNYSFVKMNICINPDKSCYLKNITITPTLKSGSELRIYKSGRGGNAFEILTTLPSKGNISITGVFYAIKSFSINTSINGVTESGSIEDVLFDGPILIESITDHSDVLSMYKEILKRINESDTFNVSPNMLVEFNK